MTAPKPTPRRSRAQAWPYKASQVADSLSVALTEIDRESSGIGRQLEAIDRLTEIALDHLENGNVFLAKRVLLDQRRLVLALSKTEFSISSRATTARTALAAARVGEYGEG